MLTNKLLKLSSMLLVLTLLSTSMISGTFAKYTTTKSVSDSIDIAKWSFEVNDTDITTNTLSVDLFNTVKELEDLKVTDAETDVTTGLIAPGTGGSFQLVLENTSEVRANYGIEFTATQSNTENYNIPLYYSLTNNGYDWVDNISNLKPSGDLDVSGTATITVYWMWAYKLEDVGMLPTGGYDATDDTELGVLAATSENNPSITVEAEITATQID